MSDEKPEEKPIDENEKPLDPLAQKLLNEKKNWQSRAKTAEEELAKVKEEKMKADNNWKAIAEEKEKEAIAWKEKHIKQESFIKNQVKETAVRKELTKLGIDSKFMDKTVKLVDLDSINYDEETGVVVGADIQAKKLHEEFTPLFGKKNEKVDHGAPNGTPEKLTIEEYRKLPLKDRKEKKIELAKALGHTFTK